METKACLLQGRVVSDKRKMTRTVEVTWSRRHRRYAKVVRRKTRLHVHDPREETHMGDLVEIRAIRPVSKSKMWSIERIVEKATLVEGAAV